VSAHALPSERKPAFFLTLAESHVQAMQGAVFFYLPSMLLSGFMFPFQGMPSWAQALGEVLLRRSLGLKSAFQIDKSGLMWHTIAIMAFPA